MMISINKNTCILVVAAHPDDELLGCGATIHKCTQAGAEAYALILAEGLTSRAGRRDDVSADDIGKLRKNAQAAAKIIGYSDIYFEDFPDNRMDSVDLLDIVHVVSKYVERINPSIVLTHHHGDLNVDHRITFQAVITACRPLADCPVDTIVSFETPSATEWNFPYYKNVFSPNIFIDIADDIDAKISAMQCYKSESRIAPHPRSPESLRAIAARWGSVIDRSYVEALELIRATVEIVDTAASENRIFTCNKLENTSSPQL